MKEWTTDITVFGCLGQYVMLIWCNWY